MCAKVVIIGHGYTSRLGIIRSLAELKCDITVVAMVFNGAFGRLIRGEGGKPIDCCSKYVDRVLYCNVKDEEGLVKLLLDKCVDPDQKVILIPDSDFSAAVIDKNSNRLKDHFVFPHIKNGAGTIRKWMDKTEQKDLARSLGMNVADGCVVSVNNGAYVFPKDVKYPCFTKALATVSGGKQFLKRCDDEKMLQNVLDTVAQKYNTEVLIEDYKEIDKEYAVVGFSDGENVVIPGIICFIANSSSHYGIAREGMIMPIDGFESFIEKLETYVKTVGFIGLFDIDFYESEGKLFFSELNLRFGGSGYAYTKMGVNLPAMMINYFNGDSYLDMHRRIEGTATYINERMCLDDYVTGYLTLSECKRIVRTEGIRFIYDEKDPGPQRKFNRYLGFQRVNRLRRKLRKLLK